MYERIKTVVLFLLVLLGMVQFYVLVVGGQDPVQVVGREAAQFQTLPLPQVMQEVAAKDATLTTVLAVPPRMIGHVPEAPTLTGNVPLRHVLLRSSSLYYANLWNRALDVLTSLSLVTRDQFRVVEPEVWNPDVYALEMILGQPTPLSIYLDLLGVEFLGDEDLVLDRIYISAYEDDKVYLSDASGTVYQGPWRSRSIIFLSALKACEGISSLAVQPLDVTMLGLNALREIYVYSAPGNATVWTIASLVDEEEFRTIAPGLFRDPVSLRFSIENVPFFEDAEQRVRLNETQLILERQWWNTVASNQVPVPLWQETASLLQSVALWPEEDLFFDGLTGTTEQPVLYLQQNYKGKPVYYLEPEASIAQPTLRVEGRASQLTTLRLRPSRLRNIIDGFPVQSQQQILRNFVLNFSELPQSDQGLLILRDIFEGFVYSSGSDAIEVWVVEFIDGSRYLIDMATGAFQAYVPAVAQR